MLANVVREAEQAVEPAIDFGKILELRGRRARNLARVPEHFRPPTVLMKIYRNLARVPERLRANANRS
jgi:hypothetical protein